MKKEDTMKMFGPAPDGSSHAFYFETEMGSKYVLTSTGMSRRLKFDGSLHEWYYRCIFVQDYDVYSNFDTVIRHCFQKRIPIWLGRTGDKHMDLCRNNRIIANLSQILVGVDGEVKGYDFEKRPLLGASVFEFRIREENKELISYHPGHDVVYAIKLK